jgi:hypothetical protein
MGCMFSSSMSSPATVKDIGIKIITLAKGITNIVKASTATDSTNDPNFNGKDIERLVESSFKAIIMLGKQAKNLDGNVLNEVLIACNILRMNYTVLAGKLAFLSNTAKTLIEERTVRADDSDDLGTSSSNSKNMNQIIVGHESHIPLSKDPEAMQINQIKPVRASRESKLFQLVERKSSSQVSSTPGFLPSLKDFSKKSNEDSSHHSNDFGFFDLSMHDNSVHEQKIRNELILPRKISTMRVQYSASQLKTEGV